MSEITKATTDSNKIFMTDETPGFITVSTQLTTVTTELDPSGVPQTDLQTVTISITSSQNA